MISPLIGRLYAHMEWADALIWQTVLAEEVVAADDYVVDSVFHLHMVQHAYLSIWTGGPFEVPTRQDFGDLWEMRDWARAFHPAATAYVAGLSEDRFGEVQDIPWTAFIEKEIGAPPAPATVGDMVFQVAAHSVHHRAQINRRLRELGLEPTLIDYIGWIWRGGPDAEWPA